MNNYPFIATARTPEHFNNQNDVSDVSNEIRAIHANSGNYAIHAMIVARFVANFAGLLLLHVQGTRVYFPLLPTEPYFELISHQQNGPSRRSKALPYPAYIKT
jgi:hypothetical protein